MIKKAAAAIVLVIASLAVAGCVQIVVPTPAPPPVPTPVPTSTHNPILEKVAAQWSGSKSPDPRFERDDMHVTWNGGNIVTWTFVERYIGNGSPPVSGYFPHATNLTYMVFATTQDASKYIDSIDKSNYVWSDSHPKTSISGTRPTVWQDRYYRASKPTEKNREIYQYDNIVELYSDWTLT